MGVKTKKEKNIFFLGEISLFCLPLLWNSQTPTASKPRAKEIAPNTKSYAHNRPYEDTTSESRARTVSVKGDMKSPASA